MKFSCFILMFSLVFNSCVDRSKDNKISKELDNKAVLKSDSGKLNKNDDSIKPHMLVNDKIYDKDLIILYNERISYLFIYIKENGVDLIRDSTKYVNIYNDTSYLFAKKIINSNGKRSNYLIVGDHFFVNMPFFNFNSWWLLGYKINKEESKLDYCLSIPYINEMKYSRGIFTYEYVELNEDNISTRHKGKMTLKELCP